MKIKFRKNEEDKIKELLSKIKVADHVIRGGISKLIYNWYKFVQECKKGYGLTIYDYINDLDGRYIIQEVLDRLENIKLKNRIISLIQPTDNSFKKLLIETNKCIISANKKINMKNKERYFWYWGIIKNAKRELLEDLKYEKFNHYKNFRKRGNLNVKK